MKKELEKQTCAVCGKSFVDTVETPPICPSCRRKQNSGKMGINKAKK